MTRAIIFAVTVTGLILLINSFAVSVEEPNKGTAVPETPTTAVKPKARIESVTMVDFYMRDGNTVSGKLLKDDPTQLLVEVPMESTIVVKTYSKREIDTRTVRTRPVPAWQYYTKLAEYFTAKTWDFVDDPDEFIQAIRCYEMAKQSLQNTGDKDKIAEIDKAIKDVQNDREVWTREVESRAKLKKLEYQAEAENRLKKLEQSVAQSNAKLAENSKNLEKNAEDLRKDYDRLDKTVTDLNKDMVKQTNNLQAQLNDHLTLINNVWIRLDLCCRTK